MKKKIIKSHYGMLDHVKIYQYTNIPIYQFLCSYDKYWLNNNQKTDLQHYANEFFGGNR